MKRASTRRNICTLILLRFINSEFTAKDIARFLDCTERQARSYILDLLYNDLIERTGRFKYRVINLTEQAYEVILALQQFLKEVELIIKK